MKYQIATTPEQSARLIACGIDPKSADMCYVGGWKEVCAIPFAKCNKEDTPAWSLSALLAMFPKEIYDNSGDMYYFSLAKEMPLTDEYSAAYILCWSEGDDLIYKRDNCPIETCTQMIEWLTENNYNLNEIQNQL